MKAKQTKRALQAEETKNRIFESAMYLFEEYGISQVSMADIAEQAHCTPGNIYHYFKNKAEIVYRAICALDEPYTAFYEKLMTDPAYAHMTAMERLCEFCCEIVLLSSEGSYLQSVYIMSIKNPEFGTLRVGSERALYSVLGKLIDAAKEEGHLQNMDNDELRRYCMMISRGLLVEWIISYRDFDILEKSRVLFAASLKGLG